MLHYKVEIYFPISPNFKDENYPFEQTSLVLSEIKQVIQVLSFDSEPHITNVDACISILNEVSFSTLCEIFNDSKPDIMLHYKMDVLKFSFEVQVNLKEYVVNIHHKEFIERITDSDTLLNHLPSSLSDFFGDAIFEILICSQIARPASLKLGKGTLWIDKKRWSEIQLFPHKHREAFEYYIEKGYPKIEFVDFFKYYSWLEQNNLIFVFNPVNSYQRAINNFSHSFGDYEDIKGLIYQMMTLELLYTDNINQISDQLNTKIQLYLGQIASYKKQIKNMYDVRSKFFHGTLLSIPSHKSHWLNDLEEYEETKQKLISAENLSLLLIISTLQKMYVDNLVDLEFKYTLASNQ